jgi:hypothetical protein
MRNLILPASVFAIACSKPLPSPSDHPASSASVAPSASAAPSATGTVERIGVTPRLVVKNACSLPIWVEQSGLLGVNNVKVMPGASTSYDIPSEGLASTRFWPKQGCDDLGNACLIGQSSPPCPSTGCSPPVDSKLEATWGCTLADKTQCGKTPQGVRMIDTFWNASAVDGYTFPFTVIASGGDDRPACINVNCADLNPSACPTDEDLSNGGINPAYKNQSLVASSGAGCFSPCMKLNYPGFGGDGLNNPAGPVEDFYCCPTPPVSAAQCHQGAVTRTKYVGLIHAACKGTAYAYAYDDGLGGRVCSGDTALTMTVGPNCPLQVLRK